MKEVISTYVEMILDTAEKFSKIVSDLHVSGDDPNTRNINTSKEVYSPRKWR